MSGPHRTDEELRQLAKSWFSEARQKSAQEETEVKDWLNARRKWSPLSGYYSGSSYRSRSDSSDSSGGDSGGGGGD